MRTPNLVARRAGFTLVELAVVTAIVGVLATLGVPRLVKSVERSKAADALEYLDKVRVAQDRYQAQFGSYAASLSDLDLQASPPRGFSVPTSFSAERGEGLQASWSLTLTRSGSSAGYGSYTLTFNEAGFVAATGSLSIHTLPEINPICH